MRHLMLLLLCPLLFGCFASSQEVRARLGQEYIGKHIDTLVARFGPPANSFRMQSGETSYVWQLASGSSVSVYRDGYRSASGISKDFACKLNVIASPTGTVTRLDTEDQNGGVGLVGMSDPIIGTGSTCAERLGMTRQG